MFYHIGSSCSRCDTTHAARPLDGRRSRRSHRPPICGSRPRRPRSLVFASRSAASLTRRHRSGFLSVDTSPVRRSQRNRSLDRQRARPNWNSSCLGQPESARNQTKVTTYKLTDRNIHTHTHSGTLRPLSGSDDFRVKADSGPTVCRADRIDT